VRIALTYAALNGLEVCAEDIRNAYLQAHSDCIVWDLSLVWRMKASWP
jgi:hypothetical protein